MPHDGTPSGDIVLITVDSLRYDSVAEDGEPADGLDGLAALADGGTFFTNAFSNATPS